MVSPAVEVKGLTKIFNRPLPWLRRFLKRPDIDEVVALDDLSMKVEEGEIFGLVGRNGQGKTTLVKSIATLLIPNEGNKGLWGGDSVNEIQKVKSRIGLVTSDERSFYWRLTAWQNMMFYVRLNGMDEKSARRRIEELFEMFDLLGLCNRPFSEYSDGNKQRLAIVRALLTDPTLMLLDEPTRSLDPIVADEMRQLIRDRINTAERKTVFITSHNLEEVEQLCSRIAIISKGKIKECATLEELRTKYFDRDDVKIRFRGDGIEGLHGRLKSKVPELGWAKTDARLVEIRFTSRAEDGMLNYVLKEIIDAGAVITGCETNRFGLKEILKQVEEQ